ncbi:MAG: DsbA family oxidoreductase [Ilumatobacteraceae bacterium]
MTSTTATEAARTGERPRMEVDIWSDVVCPWCYIGKRRFERAIGAVADEIDVVVRYRPYQLDPTAPPGTRQPVIDAYAKKFGGRDQAEAIIRRVTATAAEDGLGFRMDIAVRANTLLAHRLLWWAEQPDTAIGRAGVDQVSVKERLLSAYFVEGRDIGDPDTLADLMAGLGVDRTAVADFLDGDVGLEAVRSDIAEATDLGISAVPTFVVAGQWAIPGAQDTDTFVNVLRRLVERVRPAAACGDDSCDV